MNWLEVWERKASEPTSDLKQIDGFEKTSLDPEKLAANIQNILEWKPSDTILEVGCGAGMLAQYFHGSYVGIDYSTAMVQRIIRLLHKSALVAEANALPFKDKSFDKVFAFSVFQYFPSRTYADQVIDEMRRVAKKMIFIGDLPRQSHSPDHQLYREADFTDWTVREGQYNPDRFDIWTKLI